MAGIGSGFGGSGETAGSGGAGCVWKTQRNLDDDSANWALFEEGDLTSAVENVIVPSTSSGVALRCAIAGGSPYSNVHCYRNLPLDHDVRGFVLRLSLWYSPSSTFNNVGEASVVQALEFSVSKWYSGQRYELAVQWQNVGTSAPQWRYWDPNQSPSDRWVPLNLSDSLAAEQWHTLEVRGEAVNGQVHYQRFSIDGTARELDVWVSPASAIGELDRLAVAVQLDGNSSEIPYDLTVDNVQLATCDGPSCPDANVWYADADGDGYGNTDTAVVACVAPADYVAFYGDCDDADALTHPSPQLDPGFDVDRCGEGTLLDGMDWAGASGSAAWQTFVDGLGSAVTGASAAGCQDTGMELTYSLAASDQPNWVAVRKVLPSPIDLSQADFLLVPFRGAPVANARTIEFKLEDSSGCRSAVLFSAASGLPVFRTTITSLQQFTRPDVSTCPGVALDLSRVQAIEIGVSEIGDDVPNPSSAASGRLSFDDVTFVGREAFLRKQDFFECVPQRGDVMGRIARNLVRLQKPHGFIASWFPEDAPPTSSPSYFAYTEALNLIVLSQEFARTGRSEYRLAATEIADRLVMLQAGGAWFDSYRDDGVGGLSTATTGQWVGNIAWAVIGLRVFLDKAPPSDTTRYTNAIGEARSWLEQKIAEYQAGGGAAGGITDGVEGNISTYFALVAAGGDASAQAIAQFLKTQAWDERERHLRMGVRYWGLAIDVMGNWGAEFLRKTGDPAGALDGLRLAAGIFPVRAFSGDVTGVGDIAGPWEPTVEFTGQYAAAGGIGGSWLMDQMLLLEDANNPGAFPGSPVDFGGGDGWNTAMTGSAPSAWVYLGYSGGVWRNQPDQHSR